MSSESTSPKDNDSSGIPATAVESAPSEHTHSDTDADILDSLSGQQRTDVMRHFASSMEMAAVVSGNPFASQLNESHMTDMIVLAGKELEYDYSDRQRSRIFWGLFGGFVLLVVIGFAVFLALRDESALLSELVKSGLLFLSGLAAGLGGGYGIARRGR